MGGPSGEANAPGEAPSKAAARRREEAGRASEEDPEEAPDNPDRPEAKAPAGVKLSSIDADYKWYSAQASSAVRYLAAAGAGLVWILAGGKADGVRLEHIIAFVAFAFVMVADLLQYLVAARVWGAFLDEQVAEGKGPEDTVALDRAQSSWISRLYWAKHVLLFLAWANVARIAWMALTPQLLK
jgi:hypothetical protein